MWILFGYIRCGGSTKLRLRKPTCWTYRGGKFSNQNQKWELRLERKHKHSKIIRRKTLPSFSTTNQRKLSLSEKAMISVEALADDSIRWGKRLRFAVVCKRSRKLDERVRASIFSQYIWAWPPDPHPPMVTLLRQRFSHAASPWASAGRGVAWCANRWHRRTEAAALARWFFSGSATKVPPRRRGACTARSRKVCFEKKNAVSDAAFFVAELPKDAAELHPVGHLTGGKQPIPGLTRRDVIPKPSKTAGPPPPPGARPEVPHFGGRSPVRTGCGSRPTFQARKQAAVPPTALEPGMQQGTGRFRCTCQCITPNAPRQAPRRPSCPWKRRRRQCRP